MSSWLLTPFQMLLLMFRKKLCLTLPLSSLLLFSGLLILKERQLRFTKELELTIHRGENPVRDAPLVEVREVLPKGRDPSPSVVAFNTSFSTLYRGELLSVGCEVSRNKGGAPKILTLWKSSALIDEIGEGGSE
jgi:hypothetical protein